jgi:hypothetical protein
MSTMVTPVPYRVAPDIWCGRSATVELTHVPGGYDVHLAGEHLGYIWVDRIRMTGETTWAASTPQGVEPRRTAQADDLPPILVFLVEARTSRVMGRAFEHPAETPVPFRNYIQARLRVLKTRSHVRKALVRGKR